MTKKHNKAQTKHAKTQQQNELPTFLEHVYELRRRLFWVVAAILLFSSAAYPFLDVIIKITTAPLGGQQLYYLTPVGGFSFSIKICFYVGIIMAVPFIMFHIFKYLEPLMSSNFKRSAFFYVGFSTSLAIIGVLFAYYIALPGALRFLTGMDLNNIQAMLTVDSYLSFVMTYLLGSAIIFQIPFLFSIINTATPLQPGKLMKMQRYVIVGAFIIAAVISPTPDIMNQALLAAPIVLMYQLGVIMVWLQNKKRNLKKRKGALEFAVTPKAILASEPTVAKKTLIQTESSQPHSTVPRRVVGMDGIAPVYQKRVVNKPVYSPQMAKPNSVQSPVIKTSTVRRLRVPSRSVDGFAVRRPNQMTENN